MDVAFFSYRWKLAVSEPLLYNIVKKKKKKKKLEQVLKDMLDLLLWVRNSHYILCKTGNAGELKALLIMMFYN